MSFAQHADSFNDWLNVNMRKGGSDVPARLLTLLGMLERLRVEPTLHLDHHKAPSGAQLIEHDSFVDRALERHGVQSPVQAKGRRSNNLQAWGPALLNWLAAAGFNESSPEANEQILTGAQRVAAQRLVLINDDKPLIARYSMGTSISVIEDLLDQAQEKKRAKDVAEYLVGAKLQLKFGEDKIKPKNVNTPSLQNLADFRIGKAAIEVTTAGPDKAHLGQIEGILRNTGLEIWLMPRRRDREKWQNAVDALFHGHTKRIAVTDIETFVGQNMSEAGEFDPDDTRTALASLFARYAEQWLPPVGAGGLRIVDPENAD